MRDKNKLFFFFLFFLCFALFRKHLFICFLVVEEAAEVLEAHIVTSLCKETEHLILIGDHLQLRPNPAVYELAKKFNLEISLFERLIKNQIEYFQLKQQHRMRPCISSLLVPHIYKQLLDHPSVTEYEDIKGDDFYLDRFFG